VRIVIPSRGRSRTIRGDTLRLVPDAYVLVDEREEATYRNVIPEDRLLTHPGLGLPQIFNYMLDTHPPDEPLTILGDDHQHVFAMPGWTPRKLPIGQAELLLDNAALCAQEAGCGLFGFARNQNPTMYEPTRPWRLAQWPTSPLGFVPGHGLRFDERLGLMLDVDLALQSLLKHRIVWFDARFTFSGKALNNKGGTAHLRSDAAFARERALLKQKWGHYIRFDNTAVHNSARYAAGLPATTNMTYLQVPRVQASF
jgi:hypothetical protein